MNKNENECQREGEKSRVKEGSSFGGRDRDYDDEIRGTLKNICGMKKRTTSFPG